MRTGCLLVILIGVMAASCERDDRAVTPLPTTTPAATTQQSAAPSTARAAAIAALQAVTQPAATAQSRAQSSDPLASPTGAVRHMFELMQKRDVQGVAAMMTDPLPASVLRSEVVNVAERLENGATWEIADSRSNDVAAVVIFRTTFPDGRQDVSPLLLVNRYDRWKVLLGPLNERRFTSSEKMHMNAMLAWGEKRLAHLRDALTTRPAATTPAPPAAR